MPSNIQVLDRIISKFKLSNVHLIDKAVGQKNGESIEMILPKQGSVKMQGLAHVKHNTITDWNEGDEFIVQSTTIDQIVGEQKVAGIKMDIENYEYFGLLGAKETMQRDKPVVYLELWENENREKCFDLLRRFGYKAFVNSSSGLESYNPEKHQKQNFIFI
jgi:FkbM family methyltransferase